jgi:hypothetical protein
MKEMFREFVAPVIAGLEQTRSATARLQCFGIGEAKLGEAIEDPPRRS